MGLKNFIKAVRPKVGVSNESVREQWLEQALKKIPGGSKILDAGAGTQQYKKFCAHLNYVSQDFAQYDGQGDKSGLQMGEFDYGKLDIVSDITSIPEPDDSFDAIMCIEVLEHLPDPAKAVIEFSRLIKPGGYLIITAPFCSFTHFSPYHFSTGFHKYWYQTHLKENKFEILEITANGNFFEFLAQEIYRTPNISERYSKSKIGLTGMIAAFFLQRKLLKLSRRDSGSSEFACFGYHVVAKKI